MSHYGYVSEQLLPGWVSPPRLRRPRRAPKNSALPSGSTWSGSAATSTSPAPAGW